AARADVPPWREQERGISRPPHHRQNIERRSLYPGRRGSSPDDSRRRDGGHGELNTAPLVSPAGHRGPIEVLDVPHDVAIPHLEHRGKVHADRSVLLPIVDDDVRPPGLILVRAHDHEVGWETAPRIPARTGQARLRLPRREVRWAVGCTLPARQGGDAVEPVVGPGLTT